MQNKAALLILVLAMSSLLLFNSGCNGSGSTLSSFGSITTPTSGKCGSVNASGDVTVTSINTCYKGTLEDITDSSTHYLWNCNGINNGNNASCSLAQPPPPPPSVLAGTSNSILDNASFFYVGFDTSSNSIAHVHSTAGYNIPCGISKSSVANEDLSCLVEVPEADLYGKDLDLIFNVPAGGMCRYLSYIPYWFYNNEVGVAPSLITVAINKTINASGDLTGVTHNCTFNGSISAPCNSQPELDAELSSDSVKFSCVYDTSALPNGQNCCFGNNEIATTITINTANPVTTTVKGNWGGNYKNCIGGPGRTNWSLYTKNGIPARALQFSEISGVHQNMKITAPLNIGNSGISMYTSSIHAANYFGGYANHLHTGFVDTATTSVLPYFMDPIDDRSGTPYSPSQSSYEFQCLDSAFEVKHRIRVYIRDWDTVPDYVNFVNSQGAIVAPDRGNVAEPAANCVAIPSIGEACNDSRDIDDFLNLNLVESGVLSAPASYDTTVKTFRQFYFPNIKY